MSDDIDAATLDEIERRCMFSSDSFKAFDVPRLVAAYREKAAAEALAIEKNNSLLRHIEELTAENARLTAERGCWFADLDRLRADKERLREKNNMQAVRVAQFHDHALKAEKRMADAERRGREAERERVVEILHDALYECHRSAEPTVIEVLRRIQQHDVGAASPAEPTPPSGWTEAGLHRAIDALPTTPPCCCIPAEDNLGAGLYVHPECPTHGVAPAQPTPPSEDDELGDDTCTYCDRTLSEHTDVCAAWEAPPARCPTCDTPSSAFLIKQPSVEQAPPSEEKP